MTRTLAAARLDDSTRERYAVDEKDWLWFCSTYDWVAEQQTDEALAEFITLAHARGVANSTAVRQLAGVRDYVLRKGGSWKTITSATFPLTYMVEAALKKAKFQPVTARILHRSPIDDSDLHCLIEKAHLGVSSRSVNPSLEALTLSALSACM